MGHPTAFQTTPDSFIWVTESSFWSPLTVVGIRHLAHLDTYNEDFWFRYVNLQAESHPLGRIRAPKPAHSVPFERS